MGQPCPVSYRDARDEAERCARSCEISADVIEDIFTELDDLLLELCASDANRQSDSGNKQPEG
jgi:hypothetical protein